MALGIANDHLHGSIQDAASPGPNKDSMLSVWLVLLIPAIPVLLALMTSLVCG